MYNQTYEEYIRSILGYPQENCYDCNTPYQNFNMQNNDYERTYNNPNMELENCYPEIYKIVYPMIMKKCTDSRGPFTNEDIENMTDEIYYAMEERNEIRVNINLNNDVRTASNTSTTKVAEKKPQVSVKESTGENRETRQINRGLRDLIKILLIRELLNRPHRPSFPPQPPHGPGNRPPMRPPMRPPYGPGRPPFMREFETGNFDIYER